MKYPQKVMCFSGLEGGCGSGAVQARTRPSAQENSVIGICSLISLFKPYKILQYSCKRRLGFVFCEAYRENPADCAPNHYNLALQQAGSERNRVRPDCALRRCWYAACVGLLMKYAPTTYPHWEAPELGMVRATAASVVLSIAIVVAIISLVPARHHAPPPLVTHARMVTLPPPPPPPPEIVQPPEPLQPPPITPPPEAPAPAKIQIQKPPPKPIKRVVRHPPQHHVVPQPPPPQPQVQAPRVTNPPPPAPEQRGTDMHEYGQELHDQIQSAIEVPAAIQQLGLSGTALITCTVSPDGRLVSARVARSSGNPLIDQAALAGVKQHHYRSFTGQTASFNIPVEITGSGGE